MQVALLYNLKKENSELNGANSETSSQKTFQSLETPQETLTRIDTYAEWDTIETINALRDALAIRHDVTLIEADEFAFEKLRLLKPEIVFNVTEGKYGASREAQIPAMLEMLEIPYTGSDPVTLGICLDKSRAKKFSRTIILQIQNLKLSKI